MAKLSLEQRVKKDPKLLARVLKNPGLRSKLPAKYLSPDQRKQRTTNVRLKQPIVEGSKITERDLAREAQAAETTRYAPLDVQQQRTLGEETTRTRDIGGFYDQYLRQVAQHAQNVRAIGEQAAQTGLGTQNAVTGLAQAGLAGIQNPATADAAGRGAVAGDVSGMASNAAAIRQALVGSFVGQQAGQNAASQGYADTMANVVAPGQKLGAVAMGQGRERQAREAIAGTAREKGAFNEKYRADKRADESKNVLAQQTLTGNLADKAADNKAAAANKYGPGGSLMNDYGYTYDEWNKLSAGERSKARANKGKSTTTKTDTVYTSGAFAGKTKSEVAAMTPAQRQKAVDTYGTKDPDKPKAGKGPDWAAPGQSGKAMTQLTTLKDYVGKAKKGEPFIAGHAKQKPMTREQAATKVRQNSASLMHPALLDAAVDAVYDGFIRATTVRALITAGYKPSEVASTLGTKTSGQVGPSKTQKGSGAKGSGRAS